MRLKGTMIIVSILVGIFSCANQKLIQNSDKEKNSISLNAPESDSTEYELIIFDPGFESWFIKNRKQPWYYTKETLENKNWMYVNAWNQKVRDSQFQIRNTHNPFLEEIDYRREIDYGLDLNYKLYYYFKYIEDTWGKF